MTSWRQEGQPVERIERIALESCPRGRPADAGLQILDVREQSEWDAGHIPGSTFAPWHDIDGVPDGLDPERPIAVHLRVGPARGRGREPRAAPGAAQVIHVVEGGVPKWGRLGHPLERPATAPA